MVWIDGSSWHRELVGALLECVVLTVLFCIFNMLIPVVMLYLSARCSNGSLTKFWFQCQQLKRFSFPNRTIDDIDQRFT